MQLRTDMTQSIALQTQDLPWEPSPAPGVERRYLVRDESLGLVTSIVRYAPGASFPAHAHPGGEEILVLEGTFADEHGVYSAGTYLRNPPGSRHHPYSPDGCVIFVKLGHLIRMMSIARFDSSTSSGQASTWLRTSLSQSDAEDLSRKEYDYLDPHSP